jgi:hypothetical protein
MVSLVLHACFAVVIGYIAISSKQLKAQDAIDVSFFLVTPPQAAKRDVISKPAVVATPVPDLKVVPQTETTSRRTTLARAARSSTTAAPAASLMAGAPAAPRGQQVKVPSTSPVLQPTEQSLSTAAVLPTTSDALPTAGLPSGGITDGLSAGVGDGLGSGTGRGSFGSGSGFGQGRTQGNGKLNALVEGAGVANINASLSDVTENMVLGNGVPQLPKGSPGAIIQGRGKEIIGRLNLVRLDDPLHPNLDF